MKKIILTDCDGCLLDWEWAFQVWMTEHGYEQVPDAKSIYNVEHMYKDVSKKEAKQLVVTFNESAAIGFLPPLRDSVQYVKQLVSEGYEFHVITSLSEDKNAYKLREMNLKKLYGDAVTKLVCLPTGADKDETLEHYRNSGLYWIEDKIKNAVVGHELGLNSLLIAHGHNIHAKHEVPFPVVKDWKEIYEIITEEK